MLGTRIRRIRQRKAEHRMDELVAVESVATDYEREDRKGDLAVESKIQQLYQLMDDPEERQACIALATTWHRSEVVEGLAVRNSVDGALGTMKANNVIWLDDGPDAA